MGLGEVLVDDDLQPVRCLRQAALPQEDVVHRGPATLGERHGDSARRLAHSLDVEKHGLDDTQLGRRDAGDREDGLVKPLRSARRGSEDIPEPVALIIGAPGLLERAVRADRQDQRGDAAREHQRDGERLRP